MSVKNIRGCLAILSLVSLGLFDSDVQASGPSVVQQTAIQAQSAIADATIGWHRWGWGGGWGWGWRHRTWGWGGWGYPAFGYPAYGYGYVRPVIYTYPTYTYVGYRAPSYCCGATYYTYPTNCCYANTTSTPTDYTVASMTYPDAPVAYDSSYSGRSIAASPLPASPIQTSGTTYSKFVNSNRSNYGSELYTPLLTKSTSSTTTSQLASRKMAPSASTAYPPVPVEYAKPVVSPGPIAKRSTSVLHAEYLAASNRTETVPSAVTASANSKTKVKYNTTEANFALKMRE